MQIFRNIDEIKREKATVISVGTFDGVHSAHRQIINKILELAKSKNSRSLVITFEPHPQEVLRSKAPDIKLLSTTDEKLEQFEKLGIQNVFIIKFTAEFSKTKARDFYEKYIYAKIGISDLVIGYNHLFGRNREGGYETLKELGKQFDFQIHRVGEVIVDWIAVNSTKIRHFLQEGYIEKANMLLGYEYAFGGVVVEGDRNGKNLGYPTVNIVGDASNKVIPKDGVYCVRVNVTDKTYYGMMNIGYKPTLTAGLEKIMEVHIFDFNDDIYGEKIKISFLKRLRAEIKFSSKDELVKQLDRDKEYSLNFLKIKLQNDNKLKEQKCL
jgi:riboflavin kinase/FMN adenylyltransferase